MKTPEKIEAGGGTQQSRCEGSPTPHCSPDDLRHLAMLVGRLTRFGVEFEKCMARIAPGFKQAHEARIYRHFWLEIDEQCQEIACALGDREGTVLTFVQSGGIVKVNDANGRMRELNTPTRLVRFLANKEFRNP